MKLRTNILASVVALLAMAAAPATRPSTPAAEVRGPARWEPDIRKFEDQDAKQMPAAGGLLFVGSSSIRFWKTAELFPEFGNVINRGFGGSEMADSTAFAERVVIKYSPKVVVLYAGDNDLANGKTPAEIDQSFHELLTKVHSALPQTKLVIVSAKVSAARIKIRDKTAELNSLFENDAKASGGWVTYFNLVPLLLDAEGKPVPELFRADGLHISDTGYAKVSDKLRPVLAELLKN